MKKSTASITLAAVAGFTVLTASPAMAAPFVFDNCTQAAQYGVFNIPAGSPGYGTHLDQPVDGVGCERDGEVYNAALVPAGDVTVAPTTAPVAPVAPVTQTPQVVQMPVGGASTGVAQDVSDNSGVMALGAGFVLVAVAGGAFVVRRRATQA
ncbi:excalibur calcium-binding domain-containing protein [Arthrobacter agilis]|uniref:excalibur calcium-binding domain-containing protein n=1 Tax=Arthrobacter agilis TaxID=37921 RepID=UPI002365451F|nr:excalibur calcium-binding domain-containing protein [Arthrobacter agilis]WDF34034.1 excalibur calcium-binding domain-containing protein [Arthrobacter agilis]